MKKRFFFFMGLCSLLAALGTTIWFVAFWQRLSPAEEALFTHLFMQRFVHILLASFFLLCAVAFAIGAILYYYLIPIRKLVEETTLIATVNPSHRIILDGAGDILRLADAVNDGADRFQELQEGVGERIRLAKAKVEAERDTLARIIAGLTEGVVVCNSAGTILLYNGRAKELLSKNNTINYRKSGQAGWVGLGRSVFDVVDKKEIDLALDHIERQRERGDSYSVYSFTARSCAGQFLRFQLAQTEDQRNERSGFILTCSEFPPEHAADAREAMGLWTKMEEPEIEHIDLSMSANSSDGLAGAGQTDLIEAGRPEFYDFDLFRQTGKIQQVEMWPLTELNYTVFDTETTGLDPVGGDEIISIGSIRIVNGRLLQEEIFDQLVNPNWYMRPEVIRVHGIQPEMLEGQPTIDQVLPGFQKFAGDTVLVAHNAAFDMRFLQLKEKRTGIRFSNPVLDTLLLSAFVHPNQESHSLEAIARRLGVEVQDRHTALGDAILTGKIFLKLIPLLNAKGIKTLQEAREASRETYFARLEY